MRETAFTKDRNLKKALKLFANLADFKRVALFRYQPESGLLQGVSDYNFGSPGILGFQKRCHHTLCPMVAHDRPLYLAEAHRNGLPAQYVKQFHFTSLIIIPLLAEKRMIGSVLADRGGYYFTPTQELLDMCARFGTVASHLLSTYVARKNGGSDLCLLSPREIEVLQLAAFGHSTKIMASLLRLSEFTVRDYLKTATEKLQAKNRTEAVAIAMRMGLIQ